MSLDQIGPMGNSVEDVEFVFDIIKGQDNFDCVSQNNLEFKPKKKYTIGLVDLQDFCDKSISNPVYKKTEEAAKKNKWDIKKINLPLDIGVETYYVIVYTEFFSATRKFDGRRFGKKIEDAAGPEVMRRILGGSEISKAEYHGKYYKNALKARAFVKKQFDDLFKDVDFIVLPTVPITAHRVGEKIEMKNMMAYDLFTVLANIAGVCAISIPGIKVEGKELGLQVICPRFSESLLFDVGKKFE